MENVQLQSPSGGKYIRYAIYFLVLITGLLAIHYFSNREEINRNWKSRVETIKTNKCLAQGGKMITAGCGIARCTYKCVVPYEDGGKDCVSSSQCSHRCVVRPDMLPSVFEVLVVRRPTQEIDGCSKAGKHEYNCSGMNLTGNCEKLEPANCESFWELNGKNITAISADCSM